jgi:hypothetical protein
VVLSHIRDVVFEHFPFSALDDDLGACDLHVERRITAAFDCQCDGGTCGTEHLLAYQFGVNASHILAVDGNDRVAAPQASRFGRRPGDRADDGQIFGGSVHIRANAFILACQ